MKPGLVSSILQHEKRKPVHVLTKRHHPKSYNHQPLSVDMGGSVGKLINIITSVDVDIIIILSNNAAIGIDIDVMHRCENLWARAFSVCVMHNPTTKSISCYYIYATHTVLCLTPLHLRKALMLLRDPS